MGRVVKRETAKRDLIDHADFIADESPEAAMRFLAAAEQSFKQLAEMPALGTPYNAIAPVLKDIRRFRVKGFDNYLIFYFPLKDGIEVVRVLHGARDIEAIFES